jgi:thioesterase domain-containing protein
MDANGTYPGRLVLFRATKQSHGALQDHTLGWDVFAKKLSYTLIDATHENILKEHTVEKIAQIIASYLLDKHHG